MNELIDKENQITYNMLLETSFEEVRELLSFVIEKYYRDIRHLTVDDIEKFTVDSEEDIEFIYSVEERVYNKYYISVFITLDEHEEKLKSPFTDTMFDFNKHGWAEFKKELMLELI